MCVCVCVCVGFVVLRSADLLLVGTGEKLQELDPLLYGYFRQHGVALEPMSTVRGVEIVHRSRGGAVFAHPSACVAPFLFVVLEYVCSCASASAPAPAPAQPHALATFNVLQAEERGVCAALLSNEPVVSALFLFPCRCWRRHVGPHFHPQPTPTPASVHRPERRHVTSVEPSKWTVKCKLWNENTHVQGFSGYTQCTFWIFIAVFENKHPAQCRLRHCRST